MAGYVELSFSFALDPAAAPMVYQNYGDQKRAVGDLKEAVEGAVYKSMEGLTLNEARQSRDKIEASIIDLTKAAQERTGHNYLSSQFKAD